MSPLVFRKAITFLFLPLDSRKPIGAPLLSACLCWAGKCLFFTNLFVSSPWELGNPSQGLSWLLNVSWPPDGLSSSSLCMEKVTDGLKHDRRNHPLYALFPSSLPPAHRSRGQILE